MAEETRESRRKALKKVGKTAAFVIPAIATFQISAVQAQVSGAPISGCPTTGTFQSFLEVTPDKE